MLVYFVTSLCITAYLCVCAEGAKGLEDNQNLSSWSSIMTRLSQQPDLSTESSATITIIRRSRLTVFDMLKTSLLYEVENNGCFGYFYIKKGKNYGL